HHPGVRGPRGRAQPCAALPHRPRLSVLIRSDSRGGIAFRGRGRYVGMGPATGPAGCETMSGMKTTLLLATLTGLFLVVGQAVGGRGGMTVALALAAVMNFVSLFW